MNIFTFLFMSAEINDKEFNTFIDKGIVKQGRLEIIAEKVKNRSLLSIKETAIFTNKTKEINLIIQNGK